jgi:hypothetical protein
MIFDVRLPGGITALTFGDVDTETYALFGDFSYDIIDMFSVSVGGRYTRISGPGHIGSPSAAAARLLRRHWIPIVPIDLPAPPTSRSSRRGLR